MYGIKLNFYSEMFITDAPPWCFTIVYNSRIYLIKNVSSSTFHKKKASLRLSVFTSLRPYVFTARRIYVYKSLRPYVFTSIRLYVHTFLRPYVFTSIRLYVHTSLRPHVFTSICLYENLWPNPSPNAFSQIMWAVLSPFPSKREGDGSLFCDLTRRKFFLRLSMWFNLMRPV